MSNIYVLKEYYTQYLKKIRGTSSSTIAHYLSALDVISVYLVQKHKLRNSIYEITNLYDLQMLKEDLYCDPVFVEKDERGHRMYSAGLNNYCRFASGKNFVLIHERISFMDIPVPHNEQALHTSSQFKRSSIIKNQTIESAGYLCEINAQHQTFIAAANNHPYMEGHHAIPMKKQNMFQNSLDVYANIICLCPICHRQLHYGLCVDKTELLKKIYYLRSKRLCHSGIRVSQSEFIDLAM